MFLDAFNNVVGAAAQVIAGKGVSGLVEEDECWDLKDTQLWRNEEVRTSFSIDFTGFQTQFCKFDLTSPDKAGNVLGLMLQNLYALQEYVVAKVQIAAMHTSEAEGLARMSAFENHEWELLDKNRHFEHQLVVAKV